MAAEALFGSAARGSADALSDRDVLIVDDDVRTLAVRSAELEAQGASVASYTFSKLAALSTRGALFLQHLKLESQVIRDEEGRLMRLLSEFSPRSDYREEIRGNAALSALAGVIPMGTRGMLLAADILYVGVRNHGVLSLAERGVHAYAFDAITARLEDLGMIAPGGARALGALRFVKCLYRSGEKSHGGAARDVVDAAIAVLPSAFFPTVVRALEPQEIIAAPIATGPSAYVVLRDLERRYVALRSLGHEPCVDDDLARLGRWIANPRAYASLSSRLAPKVRDAIIKLAQDRLLFRRVVAR